MASDEQDQAESLDDDELGGRFPPDELLGANQYGITEAEERYDEPLEERISREEPDFDDQADVHDDELEIELVENDGPPEDGRLVGEAVVETDDALDVDDIASGDTTRRDVVTEREAPIAAEDAAVHLIDEP
jgi:hypothetical protein